MKIFTALLVDDDQAGLRTLAAKIDWCKLPVRIIGQVNSVDRAINLIENNMPDFIFLDIKMPDKEGFTLFKYVDTTLTDVIFTTSHDESALEDFKDKASGYLLKPIIQRELKPLLESLITKKGLDSRSHKFIRLKSQDEVLQFELEDLLYFQSNGAKCKLESLSQGSLEISMNLKDIASELIPDLFYRIHQQTIINMAYVASIDQGRFAHVIMKNGSRLEISRGRKMEFYNAYQQFLFNK